MACSISISNVVGTVSGGTLNSLTVTGTVTDCQIINVAVLCLGPTGSHLNKVVPGSATSGNWSAVFAAADLVGFSCTCGDIVEVNAQCTSDLSCADVASLPIQCCPTIDIRVTQGDCKDNGTKPVSISADITPPPNGAVVQADLILDGAVVDSGTSSSSFATLNLAYSGDLVSGSHTACVQVNQPDCGYQCTTFDFECKQNGNGGNGDGDGDGENSDDCKKTCKKWFCPFLFWIMTLSFAFGIALLILDTCLALSVNLGTVGTAFLTIGLIAFALYAFYPDCRKCLCGWLSKLLWRVCFAVGMVITTFAGCCGATFLIAGIILIVVGALFLNDWARNCHRTLCELIKEVIFVMATFIVPTISFVFGLANLQACLLVLFTIGSFAFTFADLILIVLFSLIAYDQTNC